MSEMLQRQLQRALDERCESTKPIEPTPFNAEMVSRLADGITDNTAAIRAAIDAAYVPVTIARESVNGTSAVVRPDGIALMKPITVNIQMHTVPADVDLQAAAERIARIIVGRTG